MTHQLDGRWNRFQVEAEHDSFGFDRLIVCHNFQIEKLQIRVDELERFLVNLVNNYDCDSDAHKHGTPCRCGDARKLMEVKP